MQLRNNTDTSNAVRCNNNTSDSIDSLSDSNSCDEETIKENSLIFEDTGDKLGGGASLCLMKSSADMIQRKKIDIESSDVKKENIEDIIRRAVFASVQHGLSDLSQPTKSDKPKARRKKEIPGRRDFHDVTCNNFVVEDGKPVCIWNWKWNYITKKELRPIEVKFGISGLQGMKKDACIDTIKSRCKARDDLKAARVTHVNNPLTSKGPRRTPHCAFWLSNVIFSDTH